MMDTLNSREDVDVTLGALFLEFPKIGLCGIGSMLVWTRRVIVDERHWMSEAEFRRR
jgi:chromate transport protein ChrA